MSNDFTRGKSQVMFKFLPGSIFFKDGKWFKVSGLNLNKVDFDTSRVKDELTKFVATWNINNELKTSPYPIHEDTYFYGEIQSVNYELFPLVFECTYCKNVHEYWNIESIVKQNPSLSCEFCNKNSKLKQFPYVMIHDNGDLKSLKVTVNRDAKNFKDKYRGIKMKDTRSFKTSAWYNSSTNTSLGSLGSKRTDFPITPEMKAYMSGKHASDGDVFKPAIISIVNLKNDELKERQTNSEFPYIQLSALLRLKSISRKKFAENFEAQESTSLAKNMLSNANTESERQVILKILAEMGQEHLIQSSSARNEVENILNKFNIIVDEESIINDRFLNEYLYSVYENDGKSISDKLNEAAETEDYLQKDILTKAQKKLSLIGIEEALLLEKFPVLTISPGYTRRSSDRNTSILNPYKQHIQNKQRTVVPIMLSENEAIIFKLNPMRVLAWLNLNGMLDLSNQNLNMTEAELYLYLTSKISSFETSELAEYNLSLSLQKNEITISAMIFQLLHTVSHMMLNAGKSVIGLDVDSLAEYIFPSGLAFTTYVSKLQGGGMGNLIAAFENDLERWINTTYEHTQLCLYDPVCKDHQGACHACSYLKFSCQHFNRGISRILLTGGKLGGNEFIGFFNHEIEVEIERLQGGVTS